MNKTSFLKVKLHIQHFIAFRSVIMDGRSKNVFKVGPQFIVPS